MGVKDYFGNLIISMRIRRDERFLLKEGLRKAKEAGLEINVGGDYSLIPPKGIPKGKIYLEPSEEGVDTRKLMALVADDYPEVARRYLDNLQKIQPSTS